MVEKGTAGVVTPACPTPLKPPPVVRTAMIILWKHFKHRRKCVCVECSGRGGALSPLTPTDAVNPDVKILTNPMRDNNGGARRVSENSSGKAPPSKPPQVFQTNTPPKHRNKQTHNSSSSTAGWTAYGKKTKNTTFEMA